MSIYTHASSDPNVNGWKWHLAYGTATKEKWVLLLSKVEGDGATVEFELVRS